MRTARTWAVALTGAEGHLVTIEADIACGLPATVLVGLLESALREARDRIRAAIVNVGERWPDSKISVSLYPASLPKRGSAFDLAIAIAVMSANGDLPELPDDLVFQAELGLDGRLRPVPGVLPAVLTATGSGLDTVVVATGNQAEASLVPGVAVIAADNLAEVVAWLRGGPAPRPELPGPADDSPAPARRLPDLAEVLGQAEARMVVEICAAGGHNLSLLGPPGAGKTMLAERLPTILPPLDTAAAIEVTSIHSVAGHLTPGSGLITVPPFCAPHHTSSMAAIVGGGSGVIRPGAASLAHLGILFLDESRKVLRILWQGHFTRDGASSEGACAGQGIFFGAVERAGVGGRAWRLMAYCYGSRRGVARTVKQTECVSVVIAHISRHGASTNCRVAMCSVVTLPGRAFQLRHRSGSVDRLSRWQMRRDAPHAQQRGE